MVSKLEKIAFKISSKHKNASSYENSLDEFIESLSDADKHLESIRSNTFSPEGKVIVTGLHQDLFQLIYDFRHWVDKLKFMGRSKLKNNPSD